MSIYSIIPITDKIRQSFTPTRLYIKELAGVKYFGKTSRDPYLYLGSGTAWKCRIKKYGKENIKTLWVSDLYTDPVECHYVAISFSKSHQIVESSDWANLKPEDGLAGGRPGKGRTQPGSGKKSWETKIMKGNTSVGTSKSYKQGIQTKRDKGIAITSHMVTPVAIMKSKETCKELANREIVCQLRELAIQTKTKLGSGWVRKPDHWILARIDELSSNHNEKSLLFSEELLQV